LLFIAAIIVLNILYLLSPFSLNVRPLVCILSSYLVFIIAAVDKIRGSINRCHDFDADFRPLQEYTKERWVNIALAYSRDEGLPPVELVDLDDTYFVIDGHHRISVAKMLGQREIEAEVTVWRKAALSGEGG
jgi:hypothetical protein